MVKLCSYTYPLENENKFDEYYKKYPYTLHDFQKWSIEAVVTGNHLLVCCPTGSGKTFSGEFALSYFHSKRKKTIYTTPIKALSNEKYYSFVEKYPHISVGLITGDIKTNPDADVLIMTTEILLNKLYQINSTEGEKQMTSSISFDMDIQNELGCVVFDEVHMINDEHRGAVWEQCIMMLPPQVQMVGLSATLYKPEEFALWMESNSREINSSIDNKKETYLTRKQHRAVPLIHYSFITTNATIFKSLKDKALKDEIHRYINKPHIIQDAKGVFDEPGYHKMRKMLTLFEKHKVYVKRQHTLNKVAEHLVKNEMLPALCYVFSRKQLERCAQELTVNLLEFDSKVPYIIDRECEQIIRKLPNFEEYLHLPEYVTVVGLLRKGIGIHHAGLMPILREMTEMLFARGFIKILFCTETMSVGINLPVKTTIFTDVNKFNGEQLRMLHGHEYTQAAGRAGRLGLDSVGHVIHLNNLFRNVEQLSYKQMMKGDPQKLISKFKVSYNLLLNLIDVGDQDFVQFVDRSMITGDINKSLETTIKKKDDLVAQVDARKRTIKHLKTPLEQMDEFIELNEKRNQVVNKKRKQVDRELANLKSIYPSIDADVILYKGLVSLQKDLQSVEDEYFNTTKYVSSGVLHVLKLLQDEDYVCAQQNEETLKIDYRLTRKGSIASLLKETHCLVFANLIDRQLITKLTASQLIQLFSCFTHISVSDSERELTTSYLPSIVDEIRKQFGNYQEQESYNTFKTGMDYHIQFDLIPFIEEWVAAESVEECKMVLEKAQSEKGIFLGDFVKALLKINNITAEMENVAEQIGDIPFLHELNKVKEMTLKYVVTNQSLYV